ncbi:hypothetical protein [Shewanella sp. GXUN23E]|uniref:hypothetical protein n=1 Tax=Shewanella sp. GXUN23E TaxID=3422498 RepID=UPI003D7E3C3E
MSQIDQVLAAARSLRLAGKTPSLALLKAKLKSVPMPILVQGLQRFKALSEEELEAIEVVPVTSSPANEQPQANLDELMTLRQQLQTLQTAYNELVQRVTKLEQQD